MARNFSRQPVAVAPGLTVQARRSPVFGEVFDISGRTQSLSVGEARRLKKNLDVWLEVIDFKREQENIARAQS